MINYYELAHGRRQNPPRDQLLHQFTTEDQESLKERASHWNQYRYLKMRHHLVELRREQYTLRDSFRQTVLSQDTVVPSMPPSNPELDAEIEILPLGVINHNDLSGLVFRKWEELIPMNYTE